MDGTPSYRTDTVAGFGLHTLENGYLRLSMVPELGGRIVSILDREGEREWLDGWEPEEERRVWAPEEEAVYDSGPGAGIDECLPTVLACRVGEAEIPDHGDVWSAAADFDDSRAGEGVLGCSWELGSLPLKFSRSVRVEGREIRLGYRLENLASTPTPFLWAWHPLFTLRSGDRMIFDESVDSCGSPGLDGERFPWPGVAEGQDLSRAELGTATPSCAKVFVGPLSEGWAGIRGLSSELRLEWPVGMFPWAGVWITRGFWKGLHHWAIEPTNCPVDRLSEVAGGDARTLLGSGEVRDWELRLRVVER